MEVLNCWPLVIVVEDCYYPNAADYILQVAADLDDSLINTSLACDGLAAEIDALTRLN